MGLVRRVQGAYRRDTVAVRYQERTIALYTRYGGAEVRPTRMFVWLGRRQAGRERIYALGLPPRPLKGGRKRRHFDFGSWGITLLGNPAVTVGQFAYFLVRRSDTGGPPARQS